MRAEHEREGSSGGISMVRRIAGFLLAMLLIAGSAGARDTLKVGDLPPDGLLRDASGQHVKLGDYRGKVVIISFWASWCTPCRKELPILGGIQKQAMNDVKVFSINYKESSARYREIVKVLKDFPVTFISDEYGSLGDKYGVKGIPHMVLIGRDGRITAVHEGYGEDMLKPLVKEINELLAQPVQAAPGN
jgi:thiol-disulfide isomerase/thioredoxin